MSASQRAGDRVAGPASAPAGSRLAVGSSSSSRPGRSASTPARASRCCSPPESAAVGRSRSVREADPAQRLVDPGPDLVGRYAPVLQPERHVVAAAGHHQLGLRVLEDDADPFPGLARVEPVDLDGALLLAGVLGEQAGQRGEQGALAGPGGPEQQHPLAVLDAQVDPAHRPGPPPGVPPPEPPQHRHRSPPPTRRPTHEVASRMRQRRSDRATAVSPGRRGSGPARRCWPAPGSAASRRARRRRWR